MSDGARALWRSGALWLIAILAVIAAILGWGISDFRGPGPLAQSKTVIIPKGSTLDQVADNLAAAGVIDHPWVFIAGVHLTGSADNLKAGEYDVAANISPTSLIELLRSGKVVRHKLTIAEGLTAAQVAALIQAAPFLAGDLAYRPPEGSLLPQTYFYTYGEQRQELVAQMSHAMDETLAKEWAARKPGLPLANAQQALILASIVEKETAKPEERARIAGVYIERLRQDMKLQADPTVTYAVTQGGTVALLHPLDRTDLAIDSPYNTYLVAGLPPTPIANPGLASLHAAVDPDDRGELYFVADGSGGHSFSKSFGEHVKNVLKYRVFQSHAKSATP
jgi:UPF0755 protein